MSEVRLTFAIAGDTLLDRRFSRVALDLDDFSDPLRETGHAIHDAIRDQFAAEGSPAWEPLSPRYAARKARTYPGMPILQATRRLMLSLTDADAPDAVFDVSPTRLILGTDVETPDGKWNIGLLHQLGAPNANIPARPMIRLPMTARTRITMIFRSWFASVADAQGLAVS